MRNAAFLALAGGILIVGAVLAVAFKAPRDAIGPSFLAVIGGALLVEGAILAFQRAGLGRGRRLGAVVVAAAIGSSAAIVMGLVAGFALQDSGMAQLLVGIGFLAMLGGWMAAALSYIWAARIPAIGPLTVAWGSLLVGLAYLSALVAVPVAFGWVIVGWHALRRATPARASTSGSAPLREPSTSRSTTTSTSAVLRQAAAVGLAIAVVAAGVLAMGRLAGRPTGIPGTARVAGAAPLTLLIDTDSQPDDWIAITFLLHRNDVDIRAITVEGSSPVGCDDGMRQVLGLLALAERGGIPVACGHGLRSGDRWFPSAWEPDIRRLMRDVPLPDPVSAPNAEPAVDILRTAIAESTTPVVLLTLGPLTNVSELLAAQPDVRSRLAEVVVMGGALDVAGNVGGASERAEWNIYVAPAAAHDVLRSGVRLLLVPLDATSDVPITRGFVDRLRARPKTAASTYVGDLLAHQDDFVRSGQYFFWDPFAAATAIDHSLAGFVQRGLDVDLRPGGPNGSLVAVDGDPRVSVAVSANANAFEQALLDTLSPQST